LFFSPLLPEGQYAKAWYGKGNALRLLGKYEEAKDSFERAHELDPKLAVPTFITSKPN
jgi:tetratricopeptide (TPR) repeat protein